MPDEVPVAAHNVVAAFSEPEAGEAAVEQLEKDGVPRAAISTNTKADAAIIADAEMRSEAESFVGGPGLVATRSQSKGSLIGVTIGALLGGLVGLGVGALLFGTLGMILTAAVGLTGGATVAGVVGGSVRPRIKEGPKRSLEGYQSTVGVHGDAELVAQAEAILRRANPIQIRRFGPDDDSFQVPLTTPEDSADPDARRTREPPS